MVSLSSYLRDLFSGQKSRKNEFTNEPTDNGLMFFKDGSGNYSKWLGVYSNSFRDDDGVPEILESRGHIDFVKGVDAGVYNLPDLWIWHNPKWKIGKATFVAVDVVAPGIVFAIAGGEIDKAHYGIAKAIAESDVEWRMSHTFVANDRNNNDDSFRKWVTLEVSILPAGKEANPLTRFGLLEQSEEPMIDSGKRREMKSFGLTDEAIDKLEASNAALAATAIAERQFKEKSDEIADEEVQAAEGDAKVASDAVDVLDDATGDNVAVPEEAEAEEVGAKEGAAVDEEVAEAEEVVQPVYEPVEEAQAIADDSAITQSEDVFSQFVDLFKAMDERISALDNAIKEVTKQVEAGAKSAEAQKQKEMSPVASYAGLNALLSKYARSGDESAALIDESRPEDAELIKSGPEEASTKNQMASKFNSSLLSSLINASA